MLDFSNALFQGSNPANGRELWTGTRRTGEKINKRKEKFTRLISGF
jgi:hypothetical protein